MTEHDKKADFSHGPMENFTWPDKLSAKLVDAGDDNDLHLLGYSLSDDLLQHYSFTEMAYLALTGHLPQKEQSVLLELALRLWAAFSLAEAPAHAASLARICGSSNSATISIAATLLSEQSQNLIRHNKSWLDFLRNKSKLDSHRELPSPRTVHWLRAITKQLPKNIKNIEFLEKSTTPEELILALLVLAGIEASTQISSFLVLARLPVSCAEAWTQKAASFADYPSDLPGFRYQEKA